MQDGRDHLNMMTAELPTVMYRVHHMPDAWLALHLTPTLYLAVGEPTRWLHIAFSGWAYWVMFVLWLPETHLRTPPSGPAWKLGYSNSKLGRVHLAFLYLSWRALGSRFVWPLRSDLFIKCGSTGSFKLQVTRIWRSLKYTRSRSMKERCIKFSLLCEYLIMILYS